MIEEGKQVAIEYSVFLDDNTQVDTNVGKEPLTFLFGSQQILPALENALWGLEVGDSREIVLTPDKAYGVVNTAAYKSVEAKMVPEDLRFEGALLVISDEQFGEMLISVRSLEGDQIILDFNHPLAGKTLKFDITIIHVD